MNPSVRVELDALVQQIQQTVDALLCGLEILGVSLRTLERIVNKCGLHGDELDGDLPGQQRVGLGDGAQQVVEVEPRFKAVGKAELFISETARDICAQLRQIDLHLVELSGKGLHGVAGHGFANVSGSEPHAEAR